MPLTTIMIQVYGRPVTAVGIYCVRDTRILVVAYSYKFHAALTASVA